MVIYTRENGDPCPSRTKSEETLVEVSSDSDVQIDRQTSVRGERLIEHVFYYFYEINVKHDFNVYVIINIRF